ncbi:UNVERIFIED_CONTAM: gag-pol [Trichonephila clavipes]
MHPHVPGVYFHPNLSAHVNKTSDPHEFLRQLALEVISNIPDDAFLTYTDGSRNEHSRSGSGIYISSQNYSSHTKLRNSDGVDLELIAIDTGLEEALSIPGSNRIWILSDSRSAIQHLSNWHKVGDNKGVAILDKLKRISSSREIHVQWVPSHFNIAGNEIADALAKDSATQPTMNSAPLSYSELHSTCINKQSTVPPAHHWYETKRPGWEKQGRFLLRGLRSTPQHLLHTCLSDNTSRKYFVSKEGSESVCGLGSQSENFDGH